MIASYRGYFGIGIHGIEEHVYVEINDGEWIDVAAIVNKTIRNVALNKNNGLLNKLIEDSIRSYSCITYGYNTIEDIVSSRKMSTIEYCKTHSYLLLTDDIVYCEFNGKKYKVLIIIYVC